MSIDPQNLIGKILKNQEQQPQIAKQQPQEMQPNQSIFDNYIKSQMPTQPNIELDEIDWGEIREIEEGGLATPIQGFKNEPIAITTEAKILSPEQKEKAEAFGQGEKWAEEGVTIKMSEPPKFIARDGKTYENMEDAQNANREMYAKNHPEYAEAREEGEKALEEHDKFIEEEMKKYDEEHGIDPARGTLTDEARRAEYKSKLEEDYYNNNPFYKAIKDAKNDSVYFLKH